MEGGTQGVRGTFRTKITILYFHVTSLPFYLCRWLSNANDKVNYYFKIFTMYVIVTLEVVYDHVGKCRKLALCYFILCKSI